MPILTDYTNLGGWIDDPVETERVMKDMPFPIMDDCYSSIKDSGKGKTVLLYDFVKKVTGSHQVQIQKIGDCFVKDTLVEMADGSRKAIQDINIGEYVLTPFGNIKKITNTIKKKYNKKIYNIKTKGWKEQLECTEDHKLLVAKTHDRGIDYNNLQWIEAKNLSTNDYMLLPKYPCQNGFLKFDMADFCSKPVTEDMDFKSLRLEPVEPGYVRQKGSKYQIKRHIELNEKLSWLIGLYAAEGGCDDGKEVVFNLGSHEVLIAEKAKQYIKDVFEFDASITQVPSKPTVLYVNIYNKNIAALFKYLCPGNIYTKSLNKKLKFIDRSCKIALIEGWSIGDGWQSNTDKTATSVSVSYELVKDFFDICNSTGLTSRINVRPEYKQSKESYALCLNEAAIAQILDGDDLTDFKQKYLHEYGRLIQVKDIQLNDFDDYVYCLEVEDDHAFIANGFAVHNCVSFGAAHAIQALICTEIYLKKEKEKWVGQVATEPIYGGSRVQIGNGRLGSGDGSLGVWAAKFITDYGVLSRLVYDDYDLRQYSPTRAKQWGMPRAGCPRELWDDCREHPVGTSTKVTSVEQARDLIANGYAIGIAGNKGFSNRRDKYGIARASGSWAHMMSILGVDDDGSTAGGKKTMLVCNSWPYNWISGPTRFDQPPGSFWATYDDLEYYFVRGDSWAYSNFQGYPARPAYNIDIF